MNTKSNILIAGAVIVIIGVVGFGGYQAINGSKKPDQEAKAINIVKADDETKNIPQEEKTQEEQGTITEKSSFIASKNGKRYFPTSCGSAQTIKSENAVYFESESLAELAGYTKSLQCKY